MHRLVWLVHLSPRNIPSIYRNDFELSRGGTYQINFLEYISVALFIKTYFYQERKVENQILWYHVSNDPKMAWFAGWQAVETSLTPPNCVVSPNQFYINIKVCNLPVNINVLICRWVEITWHIRDWPHWPLWQWWFIKWSLLETAISVWTAINILRPYLGIYCFWVEICITVS